MGLIMWTLSSRSLPRDFFIFLCLLMHTATTSSIKPTRSRRTMLDPITLPATIGELLFWVLGMLAVGNLLSKSQVDPSSFGGSES